MFGSRNAVKQLGNVSTVLDKFQGVLDDYEEAAGDVGINDQVKKTIMMQLLPPSLKTATCDTLMAAHQTFKGVTPEYLSTITVQRCESDEATMGTAVTMDAGAVEAATDDAGSLGQRGVGPGLGKGRPPTAPVAPTLKLPPGGILGWIGTINGLTTASRRAPAAAAVPIAISVMTAQIIRTRASTPQECTGWTRSRQRRKKGQRQR